MPLSSEINAASRPDVAVTMQALIPAAQDEIVRFVSAEDVLPKILTGYGLCPGRYDFGCVRPLGPPRRTMRRLSCGWQLSVGKGGRRLHDDLVPPAARAAGGTRRVTWPGTRPG